MRALVLALGVLALLSCEGRDRPTPAQEIQRRFYGPEFKARVDCIWVEDGKLERCSTSDRRTFTCVARNNDGCRVPAQCIEEFSRQ